MPDIDRIGKIVSDIQRFEKELISYSIKSVEDLRDSKTYHASAMLIFGILNRFFDLGQEILAMEKVGAPTRYADILPLLCKAGYLNKEQEKKINKLIESRNIMAHFYYEVNERDLFNLINNLNLIDNFISTVKRRMRL